MENTQEIKPWWTTDPLLEEYYIKEWCIPVHDDHALFEYLLMEWMSAGLSWLLMLKKRECFQNCFCNFDFEKIALLREEDINRILRNPEMIHSRSKIEATINNARCFKEIISAYGSFDNFIWGFTQGRSIACQTYNNGALVTRNELSDRIAKELKKFGFKYLGSVLVFSYLQAIGILMDKKF